MGPRREVGRRLAGRNRSATQLEDLRILAAQAATGTMHESGGITRQMRIAAGDVAAVVAAIDDLVAFCAREAEREAERVAELWSDLGGATRADIEAAVHATETGVDLNRDVEWGDDVDSPLLLFAMLRSLRAAVIRIAANDAGAPARVLIYWSWEPA